MNLKHLSLLSFVLIASLLISSCGPMLDAPSTEIIASPTEIIALPTATLIPTSTPLSSLIAGHWEGKPSVNFDIGTDGNIHNFRFVFETQSGTCTVTSDEVTIEADRTFAYVFGEPPQEGDNTIRGTFESDNKVTGSYSDSISCEEGGIILGIIGGGTWSAEWQTSEVPPTEPVITLETWDKNSGQPFVLEQHAEQRVMVAFSPTDRVLVAGFEDGTIKVWDTATGEAIHSLNISGQVDELSDIVFSPDGTMFASASDEPSDYVVGDPLPENGVITLWDTEQGSELCTIRSTSSDSIAFSPDGKWLASGSADTAINVWSMETGETFCALEYSLGTPSGDLNPISQIAISADGKWLASTEAIPSLDDSGSAVYPINLWDIASKSLGRTLTTGHTSKVNTLAFSPDGGIIATGSDDSTIQLFDVSSGQQLQMLCCNNPGVYALDFSADGTILASGALELQLWDVASGEQLQILTLNESTRPRAVLSLEFSSDGQLIAGSTLDAILLWWVSP